MTKAPHSLHLSQHPGQKCLRCIQWGLTEDGGWARVGVLITKDAGPLKLKCWNAKNCRFFCLKLYPSTNMKIPRRNLSFQMYLLFFEYCMLYQFEGIWVSSVDFLESLKTWIWDVKSHSSYDDLYRYQQYQIESDKRSWKKKQGSSLNNLFLLWLEKHQVNHFNQIWNM